MLISTLRCIIIIILYIILIYKCQLIGISLISFPDDTVIASSAHILKTSSEVMLLWLEKLVFSMIFYLIISKRVIWVKVFDFDNLGIIVFIIAILMFLLILHTILIKILVLKPGLYGLRMTVVFLLLLVTLIFVMRLFLHLNLIFVTSPYFICYI